MAEPRKSDLLVDTSTPPDVMNDPQYATNTAGGEDGAGDPDTCRICRGEGSDAEPLFHPCKCSGSIKHVHQDCLMEWLSHSQKKHCELCKTPFRFTKLYSPNMPQSLPPRVFIRHFFLHSMRNIATWLRFCMVVAVWLGCLPYVIRQVWRLLFWFSDGGWPLQYMAVDPNQNSTQMQQASEVARELYLVAVNGTSPVSPLNAAHTTPAGVGGLMEKLVRYLMPISQTLNVSAADPLAGGLFTSIFYGLGIPNVAVPSSLRTNASVSQFMMNVAPTAKSPSLLSDIPFLKDLTRHSAINQLVITIAEGYIITILVVAGFILVFLIREWVVQQQPGINMGAGFNAGFAAPERREQAALEEPLNEQGQGVDGRVEPRERPIARPRRRVNANVENGEPEFVIPPPRRFPEVGDALGLNRPVPVRDALAPATELQRQIAEEPRMTEEFLAIWRRADSDPQEVLRIIERENKGDQLRYWVNAMKILQHPPPGENSSPEATERIPNEESSTLGAAKISESYGSESSVAESLVAQAGSERGSASGESWVDVTKPLSLRSQSVSPENRQPAQLADDTDRTSHDKGKGKATEESQEPLFDPTSQLLPGINYHRSQHNQDIWNSATSSSPAPVISRPRAISDGPPLRDTKSPLANDNWSFRNLPDNEENKDPKVLAERLEFSGTQQPVFIGESAMTFKGSNDLTPKPGPLESQSPGSPAWKSAQDLRVQQAIAKGREAYKSASERHVPPVVGPYDSDLGLHPDPFDFSDPIESKGLDGDEEINQNVQGALSDSEDEIEELHEAPETNPFAPDTLLPERREPIVARPAEPQGILGNVADWLWGGADEGRQAEQGGNDEHIVQDLAAEAPFVPVAHRDLFVDQGEFAEQDREVVEAAIAAGIDPDAIDDAEDFEGVMELIGMRGPIFSLVQNALFSAFLLALTVAFGVWIPYNIGRVTLLLAANPGPAFKLPLRLVFWCAAFLQDAVVSILGLTSYCIIALFMIPFNVGKATGVTVREGGVSWAASALGFSRAAVNRILDGTINSLINFTDSDMFAFSAASHESLLTIKSLVTTSLEDIGRTVIFLFVGDYKITFAGVLASSIALLKGSWGFIASIPVFLAKPDSWVISLEVRKRALPLDLELSVWDGWDRFWATLAGYTALSLLGALYVKKGSPFSTGQVGREWEATIIDLLHQAGGVLKVILIISIEMLVFPLYCGLLLDAALLPLFENATIMSRILFTFKSPLTSIFVHWFVGTCYMFHFALFVSMCRKIMRKGVLYFIRDPDDPTFHPVRDVLERNVATQLRKILFSALVYGALVVICLGGVVWGIAFAFNGVLPIHWSSNEPVLEFPIDLLFYNFLMPLAVKFFKPSDGLHAMYSWWFRQCAKMLRLTWFMFDERRLAEEGQIVQRAWKLFNRNRSEDDPLMMIKTDDPQQPFIDNPEIDAYIRQDGRYVRAPASDQVRIPKGSEIFLEVDEHNTRIDGKRDRPDGAHGRESDLYKQVYIPPHFRLRICIFILSIWLFAALTGVCITIVPLVFGRRVFSNIIPSHVRKNDVYAFSIGIYILGSVLYLLLHARHFVIYLVSSFSLNAETPANIGRRAKFVAIRASKIFYVYFAFLFLLPTLFGFLIEFYAILPLHTYFSPAEPHTIHFVQSWTLGLLYVKLTTRLIQFYPDSRPAASLRMITRDGYLNPDARLATRSFILPATFALSMALVWPWAIARLGAVTVFKDSTEEERVLVYRFVYPAILAAACLSWMGLLLGQCVRGWRMRIRDEVYLIGERLHNFGEKKAGSPGVAVGAGMPRRIET